MKYTSEDLENFKTLEELRKNSEDFYNKLKIDVEQGKIKKGEIRPNPYEHKIEVMEIICENACPEFELKDQLTIHSYSDSHPFEVIEVVSKRKIVCRMLDSHLINSDELEWDSSSCINQEKQKYLYTPNSNNITKTLTLRNLKYKDSFRSLEFPIKKWAEVGTRAEPHKTTVTPGAKKFVDFNF